MQICKLEVGKGGVQKRGDANGLVGSVCIDRVLGRRIASILNGYRDQSQDVLQFLAGQGLHTMYFI